MRIVSFVTALTLAGGIALANVAPPPEVYPQHQAADVVVAYMENFNAGNADGIASTFSDSGTFFWVENGQIVARSKAEAVEKAKRVPAGARIETDDSRQVVALGDKVAEAIVPFTFHMKDDKGQEQALFTGVMTLTIAPDADGVWRIVSGHTSSSGRE